MIGSVENYNQFGTQIIVPESISKDTFHELSGKIEILQKEQLNSNVSALVSQIHVETLSKLLSQLNSENELLQRKCRELNKEVNILRNTSKNETKKYKEKHNSSQEKIKILEAKNEEERLAFEQKKLSLEKNNREMQNILKSDNEIIKHLKNNVFKINEEIKNKDAIISEKNKQIEVLENKVKQQQESYEYLDKLSLCLCDEFKESNKRHVRIEENKKGRKVNTKRKLEVKKGQKKLLKRRKRRRVHSGQGEIEITKEVARKILRVFEY